MGPEWKPANECEVVMAAALEEDQAQDFARSLTSSPLYVPELPDSADDVRVEQLLPREGERVLVYTSPETLSWAVGDIAAQCWKVDFPTMRRHWPGSEYHLAVNAGTPIAVFLSIDSVTELADGRESLVSIADVRARAAQEALHRIRLACWAELSGADAQPDDQRNLETLTDHGPVNAVEVELREAVDRQDSDAYLYALLAADVVVPTVREQPSVGDGDGYDAEAWLVAEDGDLRVIPMFTSADALERIAGQSVKGSVLPFVDVLGYWPSIGVGMCINPGEISELTLPGDVVVGLSIAVDEED